MSGRHWDRSEVDQLVLLMALEPPVRPIEIARRLGRRVRQVNGKIERLRKSGALAPSTWALTAAMQPEQRAVLELYRRKEMPAWQCIRAALTVQVGPFRE